MYKIYEYVTSLKQFHYFREVVTSMLQIRRVKVNKKYTFLGSQCISTKVLIKKTTVKPLLSGPPIKRAPSIKQTLGKVPKVSA